MRLSKFVLLIVMGLAFIAGMAAHSAMVRRGISLRDAFGLLIQLKKCATQLKAAKHLRSMLRFGIFSLNFPVMPTLSCSAIYRLLSPIGTSSWILMWPIEAFTATPPPGHFFVSILLMLRIQNAL